MVYRRRTYRRRYNKRTYRKKWSKKTTYRRRTRGNKQPVHYFKRHVDRGTITSDSSGTATTGGLHFKLEDVPNYSEFTALYDAYKICAVKVNFIPISNVTYSPDGTATASWSINYERMFTAIDCNSSSVGSTIDELRQYRNCKWSKNNVVHSRFFYPKVQQTVETSIPSETTGKQPWISTTSASCSYYGLKYAFEQTNNDNNPRYRVECVYYMKFKAPR